MMVTACVLYLMLTRTYPRNLFTAWPSRLWTSKNLLLRSSSSSSSIGLQYIYDKIKFSGPVTVADYARECLLHPSFGYYMQRDVFGQKGDFITSPEVSQVFGELLAVWVLSDWMSRGQPSNCQLVELGPGRGTLLKDILRVFSHRNLCSILEAGLSLHLVEASPVLSNIQERTLQRKEVNPTTADTISSAIPYKTCTLDSHHRTQASWYQRLQDVPRGPSYFIAHEFFDALPVHQFQRTAKGWREVLVDIDPEKEPEKALRFVLAPSETPASVAYSSLLPQTRQERDGGDGVEWCELCPEGLVIAKELAERVKERGGAALVADYGEEMITKNTLRGFKEHALHDVLESPGTADLTADVDFGAIKRAVLSEGAGCCGPMPQNEFLHRMGIRQRIEMLMKGASSSQAKDLVSSYEVLTSPEKMGERFKFLTITSDPQHIPTPFNESTT